MELNRIKKAIKSIKSCGRPDGTFSSRELFLALGKKCHGTLRELVESGKVEYAGKYPAKNICGNVQMTPMYRLCK